MNETLERIVNESERTLQKAIKEIESYANSNQRALLRSVGQGLEAELTYRAKTEAYSHSLKILEKRIQELRNLLPWEELPD